MILFYIRHGEPVYDPDGLTENGKLQAKALAEKLKDYGIEKIYASDSNRAIQTAQPTADAYGFEIEKLHWCHEGLTAHDFNALADEGKFRWCFHHTPTKKLFLSKEVASLGERWYEHDAFKDKLYGQGIKRVQAETDEFLKNLGFIHDRENKVYKRNGEEKYKKVALFAHQGFGMAFLSSVMDIPYPYFCTHFDFGFSGVSVVYFEDCEDVVIPLLLQHANDAHLYKAGLPLRYNHEFDI